MRTVSRKQINSMYRAFKGLGLFKNESKAFSFLYNELADKEVNDDVYDVVATICVTTTNTDGTGGFWDYPECAQKIEELAKNYTPKERDTQIITRTQIGVIYREFKKGNLKLNKKTTGYLYNTVAGTEYKKDSEDYKKLNFAIEKCYNEEEDKMEEVATILNEMAA